MHRRVRGLAPFHLEPINGHVAARQRVRGQHSDGLARRHRAGQPQRAPARAAAATAAPVRLERAAEMGRFFLGSTVIVLLPRGAAVWNEHCIAGAPVRMGQQLSA